MIISLPAAPASKQEIQIAAPSGGRKVRNFRPAIFLFPVGHTPKWP